MDFKEDSVELSEKELSKYISRNIYKIRECSDYKTEYKECKSIRGRFQQYFVYGDYLECTGRKEDYTNCKECSRGNLKACVKVIKSADDVLERRMKAHMANDVWKKRTEPPEDWNKPLPDFLAKEVENSFKILKSRSEALKAQSCTIL